MGQNSEAMVETSIMLMMWQVWNHVMFYMGMWHDFLVEKGVPPGLFYFVLGIVFTILMYFIRKLALRKKSQSTQNLKYLGVGKIFYDERATLGCSPGSVVYSGRFETKDAAVKVIKLGLARDFAIYKERFDMKTPKDFEKEAAKQTDFKEKRTIREVSINQAITLGNDYIVQYHGQEVFKLNKTVYLLIGLELCKANLQKVVDKWSDFKPLTTGIILHDLAEALYFLHTSGYVHRDLKPSNILVRQLPHQKQWRIKVADFGATKWAHFVNGKSGFSVSGPYGSDDWTAPEAVGNDQNQDGKSSGDIFSMGLIFFFVITRGSKLYKSQREINLNLKDTLSLNEALPKFTLEMNLIDQMTNRDEANRPTADEVRKHPALWDSQTKIDFTATVNEFLKTTDVPQLEANHNCFNNRWDEPLTVDVKSAIRQRGSYRFNSVKDLIHAIRNFGAHFPQQNSRVRREFGQYPDKYIRYWTKRFPRLLLHTYNVMERYKGRRDSALGKFYRAK